MVKVLEQFNSIQGEGPSQGLSARFWRLAGCNMKCSFCDTKYTWSDVSEDKLEEAVMTSANPVNVFVITGGEPLWKANGNYGKTVHLVDMIRNEYGGGALIEIETNGTCYPLGFRDANIRYIVSPKLPNAGDGVHINAEVLSYFDDKMGGRSQVVFKVVAKTVKDIDCITDLLRGNLQVPRNKIWIMPEGTTRQEVINKAELLMPTIVERGYNISMRLHYITGCK